MGKIVFFLAFGALAATAFSADRYEAEAAIPADDHSITTVTDASASGGSYVEMREGNLLFTVTAKAAGYYTLYVNYAQPNDANGKIQNVTVNGSSAGQISFPYTKAFTYMKGVAKFKLNAGTNTIGIVKSWGWVNIDYIEITDYVETPFAIANGLVTPDPSKGAQQIFSFLYENFGKKVVSGVMTNTVMQNDGKYTPCSLKNQTELAWIDSVSGKLPALVGFDFLHSTGLNSTSDWHHGYTSATVAMAESLWAAGGIPTYTWHWKDPSDSVEAFYTASSGNTPYTTFDLNKAFKDSTTYAEWDSSSTQFQQILSDIDSVSAKLTVLRDAGVAILWRPLHEAAGKWFWWGYRGAAPCKALYRLVFDRMVNYHKLNNLVWVWVTDESSDALDWYPGDAYVDIVGRDYYYYPREANHASLVASFENVKTIFSAKKLIALSENGSIPYPDSMVADGANWSYFMPWYGDYTMDGWAHDNTAADWKTVMNNDYVITLDKMPGWSNYVAGGVSVTRKAGGEGISLSGNRLSLSLTAAENVSVDIYDISGARAASLYKGALSAGTHAFALKLRPGVYTVRVRGSSVNFARAITVR